MFNNSFQDPTAPVPLPQPTWEQFLPPGILNDAELATFIHEQRLRAAQRRPDYFERWAAQQQQRPLSPAPKSSQPGVVQQVPIGAPAQPSVGFTPAGQLSAAQPSVQVAPAGAGSWQPFAQWRGFR